MEMKLHSYVHTFLCKIQIRQSKIVAVHEN